MSLLNSTALASSFVAKALLFALNSPKKTAQKTISLVIMRRSDCLIKVGAFAFDERPIEAVKMFKLSNRMIIRIGEDPVVVFEEGENAFVLKIIRQDRPQASSL